MTARREPIQFPTVGGQGRLSPGQWCRTTLSGPPQQPAGVWRGRAAQRRPPPPDRARFESLANLPAAVWRTLCEWHRRSAQRRSLAEIVMHDRHLLRDIGCTPTEVRVEVDKWFWQA